MDLHNKIINVSKDIIIKDGVEAINIRTIAKLCNISIGSFYNYFPSKSELVFVTISSIWKDIFNIKEQDLNLNSFVDCIESIFQTVQKNSLKYPNFFVLHRSSFSNSEKHKARQQMNFFILKLKAFLADVLKNDKNLNKEIFNDIFTIDIFIDYVLELLISSIIQNKSNCTPLLILIKKIIY